MRKQAKVLSAIVFIIGSGLLSIKWHLEKKEYLASLKRIDEEKIKSIIIASSQEEQDLISVRKEFSRCLSEIKPRLIRGGDEVISVTVKLSDGGFLYNNLVVFHESKTIVFGHGENLFESPSLRIHQRNSNFSGVSKCLYSLICG